MNELLANPKALLALFCVGALVVSFNLILFGLLRGDKTVQEEISKWGRAAGGAQESRRRQDAQLDELHRAVANLKPQHTDEDGEKR
jgi:L-arabinose isomerase